MKRRVGRGQTLPRMARVKAMPKNYEQSFQTKKARNGLIRRLHLDGETRTFLQDYDTVIMHGYAEKNNVRIGFGDCKGKILPAF